MGHIWSGAKFFCFTSLYDVIIIVSFQSIQKQIAGLLLVHLP